MKFTGHERDLHSLAGAGDDLDYMHARYCSPMTGRFLSVDPLGGTKESPQGLNLYAYARNNPLKYIDPDGNREARLYGEVHDVEPGDVVTLTRIEDPEWSTHTAIVGGFGEAPEGAIPDALIYEAVPKGDGTDRFVDESSQEPSLTNSNDPSAGGGRWNGATNDVGSVAQNRKPDGTSYSAAEVSAAVTAVGPITYSNQHSGSYGPRCDCAGFVNQVVYKLQGASGPPPATGNTINDWLHKGRVP